MLVYHTFPAYFACHVSKMTFLSTFAGPCCLDLSMGCPGEVWQLPCALEWRSQSLGLGKDTWENRAAAEDELEELHGALSGEQMAGR